MSHLIAHSSKNPAGARASMTVLMASCCCCCCRGQGVGRSGIEGEVDKS